MQHSIFRLWDESSQTDFLVIYIFRHIVDFTGKLKEEAYTYYLGTSFPLHPGNQGGSFISCSVSA